MKRIEFIDQLKAVSIFLIVYGHNDYTSDFGEYLSSFRLPLFFIISGFVRKNKSTISFSDFIHKSTKRLLIPYFILSTALFVLWFFVGRHYGAGKACNPLKNFLGIFYSQGGSQYMDWGIPMWFLTALFCVLFIDFFVARLQAKWQYFCLFILVLIGYYTFRIIGVHLPWSFDVALVVYPFYYLGARIKEKNILERISNSKRVLIAIVAFFIHLILSQYNSEPSFYYGKYGNLPLMYINGMLGFIWIFFLFSLLPSHRFITWLGRNTLPVLAFHLTAMSFIKAFLLLGFGQEISSGVHYYFIYSFLQILLLVPFIHFLNKYIPFAVGTQKKK